MDLGRFRDLVSPKVGLIREVGPQARGADEAVPPHLYVATLSHFDFRLAEKAERIGAGKGRTQEEAVTSAIGEAIERYCAYQWDPSRTYVAPVSEVLPAAITPAACVLYSEPQYARAGWRFPRFDDTKPVTWMKGVELPSRAPVALPASLVYLVHPPPRAEDLFAPASSNGLAAGSSEAQAVLGGLCELMERDALLIAWLNRLPAAEIDLARAGQAAITLQRHYARLAVELRAFVLPSDLPATTVMAISFEDDPARPAQVVGMGCHPNPEIALTKALFELCQGRPSEGRRFLDKPPRGRLQRPEDVLTLDDHSAFASLPENRGEFGFLWQGGRQGGRRVGLDELPNPSTGDVERDLETCVRGLQALGVRVAFADLTTSDVVDFGLHVVRVLAPGLQPIHFGHGQERRAGGRLFEVPARLGFGNGPRSEADLNPFPHPLA